MENQADMETLVGADNTEVTEISSSRTDETSGSSTCDPTARSENPLVVKCTNSQTYSILSCAQVPEVNDSQLFNAGTVNKICDQEKQLEKLDIHQERKVEKLCLANKKGNEDAGNDDTYVLPAISSTAVGNLLSPVLILQDDFLKQPDPILETNSSEDATLSKETSSSKRICLVNLICEGPASNTVTSDAESLSTIEAEEHCEKDSAEMPGFQHAAISKIEEVMRIPPETCVENIEQKDSCVEDINGISIGEKLMVVEHQKLKEVEPIVFTTIEKPDDSPCEGNTCNTPNVILGLVQEDQVLRRIRLLQRQVEHSLDLYSKRLSEDFLSVQKFFEDLNQQDTLLQEMSSQADNLKETLDSVLQLPESSKSDVLDRLEACFNSGHWLEKSVKTKELANCKQLMTKGYVSLKYGGVSKVKAIINQHLEGRLQSSVGNISLLGAEDTLCDPYLVTVTSIIDPGEFYVIRLCDSGKLETILTSLKENAASYPIPLETFPGHMYAVCNSALNWFRGVCGKECGRQQVGDQPMEILYEFFMIDRGHHELIPASSIRLLPSELQKCPPIARECTLNQNFQGTTWSLQTINLFKQMTRQSPMNMKVFKQHGGVLEVDLGQLISFGEGANIVSVRDALFFSHRPTSITSLRKFKPKFLVPKIELLKQFSVKISSAETPIHIYVQILDEEFRNYRSMYDALQTEMANVPVNSISNFQHIRKGFICAVTYLGDWYRCLVEEIYQHNRVLVFYVDTGHRQTVHCSECLNLPDTFLDLPSQAVRCVLDGINPLIPRAPKADHSRRRQNMWSREVIEFMRGYRNKPGVIIVENWKIGEVGHLGQELTATVILYRDGEQKCLNSALSRAGLVTCRKEHWYPEHAAIRSSLSMQRRISQSTSIDSLGSGTYAASMEASQTPFTTTTSITSEPIDQAPSMECGQDGDRKNFDSRDDDSESSYSGRLPISIVKMSSDDHRPNVEVTSPSGIAHEAQECSADSSSLIDVIPRNAVGSNSKSFSIISNPEDNCEFAVENLRVSELKKHWLPTTPMKKSTFEGASASCGQGRTLEAQFTNFDSSVPVNSPGFNVLASVSAKHKEKVAATLTNKKVSSVCSAFDQIDIVGISGTQPEYETSITVSYVWMDSPNAIYFRTGDMQTQFEEVRYKMRQHYRNLRSKEKTKFEVGFRCAVEDARSFWRAEVVCIDNYPTYDVLLVDTGYKRRIRAKYIHKLEPNFDELKRLVLKCSLHNVFCGTTNGIWKEECIKHIHDRLLGSESINIFRREQQESKYEALPIMCLYLYNVEGGPLQIPGRTQINLNDELVSMGLAQNRSGILQTANVVPAVRTWRLSEPPVLGSVFWGVVTWVSLTGEIYLHDVKSIPEMNEINKWLNEAYSDTDPTEADLRCRPGDLCIAKYEIDSKWYRGLVKEIEEGEEKVTVFFVDYGTLDSVDRRDIRLNIMLEELPTLTICCKLFNIRSTVVDLKDGKCEWPMETLDHIHKLTVEHEFRVIVKGKGHPLPVALVTRKQSSIASYLVERNMAEIIDPNLKKKKSKNKKREKI